MISAAPLSSWPALRAPVSTSSRERPLASDAAPHSRAERMPLLQKATILPSPVRQQVGKSANLIGRSARAGKGQVEELQSGRGGSRVEVGGARLAEHRFAVGPIVDHDNEARSGKLLHIGRFELTRKGDAIIGKEELKAHAVSSRLRIQWMNGSANSTIQSLPRIRPAR